MALEQSSILHRENPSKDTETTHEQSQQESFTYGDLDQLSRIVTSIERQAMLVKLQAEEKESKIKADQEADALLDFA